MENQFKVDRLQIILVAKNIYIYIYIYLRVANIGVITSQCETSGKNHVLNLLELAAFWMEVKVLCSLSNPFSLKTIQTRAGRAILTAISLACAAHK